MLMVQTPDPEESAAGYHAGHSLWTPWSLPIAGTYNGYGVLRIEAGWHSRFICSRLEDVVLDREEGDNPFIETAVRKTDLALDVELERLQALIRQTRILVHADVDRKVTAWMGMAFIREDIYQALVDAPAFTESAILTAKDSVGRESTIMRKNKPNPLHTGQAADSLKALEGTEVGAQLAETLQNLNRYRNLTESVGSYGPPGIRGIGAYRLYAAERVMSGIDKNDPDLLDAVVQLGSFIHFLAHFEFLRKLWQPQNGLGSQRTGWGSYVALNMAAYRVAHAEFEKETEKYEDPPVKPTP